MGADSSNFGVVNEVREQAQRRQTFEGFLVGRLISSFGKWPKGFRWPWSCRAGNETPGNGVEYQHHQIAHVVASHALSVVKPGT